MSAKPLNETPVYRGLRAPRRLLFLLGTLALAGCVTAVVADAAIFGGNEQVHSVSRAPTGQSTGSTSESNVSPYPANAAGETYGSAADAATSQEEPDLIQAVGATNTGNIVTGYVRKSELNAATGADVRTPAEAVSYSSARTHDGATTIPLYTEDGQTIIGHFTIPAYTPPPAAP